MMWRHFKVRWSIGIAQRTRWLARRCEAFWPWGHTQARGGGAAEETARSPSDLGPRPDPRRLREPSIVPAGTTRARIRLEGRITFDGVMLSVDDARSRVCEIDLDLRAGETIAIFTDDRQWISALTELLTGRRHPASGELRIDGCDSRLIAPAALDRKIAVMTRAGEPAGTRILDSIARGRPGACHAEIVGAAIRAHAHDFIGRLPEGYATRLDACRPDLTTSQRRRIAVARMLLRNAPIAIIEEPLSGIELDRDDAARVALLRLLERRTSVILTHDLATALLADRIFAPVGGRVRELSHEQLLPKPDKTARVIHLPVRGRR